MKKLLLLGLGLAASLAANAQGIIYAEETFDWLLPYGEAYGLGDPVGTEGAEVKCIPFNPKSDANAVNGKTFKQVFWDQLGYTVRMWNQTACYEIHAYNGYVRFGGDEGGNGNQRGGIRWLADSNGYNPDDELYKKIHPIAVPSYPDELYLSFDWCPYREDDGSYHPVQLMLETRSGSLEVENNAVITHNLEDGAPYEWQHVEIDLYDTVNEADPNISDATNYMIQPIKEQQKIEEGRKKFWYYLDNLMLHSESTEAGVKDVTVDANAPVEYFNLQGVRVENPENGLYIRRQGNKTSKVYKH